MKVSLAVSLPLLALASANGLAQIAPAPKGVPVPSTTVTTANPSAVKLTIGGPAQTVMLNGTLMDRITAAYVANLNGGKMTTIQAALLPVTGATQRQIVLTAASSAQPSAQPSTLSVVVLARIGSTALLLDTIKVPLQLDVVAPVVLVHRDQLFGAAVSAVLQGATTSFTSCGTPSDHVFAVTLPNSPYAVNGAVPRLEHTTSLTERAEYLRTHSIDPTDLFNLAALANLTKNGHPSPIPHTVAAVRTCLEPFSTSNWSFSGATEIAGAAEITVSVRFPTAVFRARGMPADVTGAFTALNIGLGWGDNITDLELPDFLYAMPTYEVQLPVTLASGKISYGPAQWTLKQQTGSWQSQFLGLSSSRSQLEQYAAARMTQVGVEIRKAFDAANTRVAINKQIANRLQAGSGITNVVGLRLTTGDMWEIQYK